MKHFIFDPIGELNFRKMSPDKQDGVVKSQISCVLSLFFHKTFIFSQDSRLTRRLAGRVPREGIFLNPDSEANKPIKGQYNLNIKVLTFEEDADVDSEFVVYGQVSGWAGTDAQRRDLGVALLWGTPIAVSFGLLAALGTTITTMVIAAIGVWFGGWVDDLVQRLTELNMILAMPQDAPASLLLNPEP